MRSPEAVNCSHIAQFNGGSCNGNHEFWKKNFTNLTSFDIWSQLEGWNGHATMA